ncbi:putative metal-dependent phosphoesterase TrpH [Methanocalculus alkaliphilus]|uniref:PHP domain-containing protein n=1 Tax=Methanocalculus alkaliphilus TaxID=768730 RepID=UPI0020A10B79|nr:PHP domain-containing protein [Methanocalculus alkaliphilus]MCP1716315.1 putative metal-dependent phosphoesterase TrpH [Methanocalculus alkaliphilus]
MKNRLDRWIFGKEQEILALETDGPPPKYADLHLHTTASDGTLTPRELVIAAKDAGLSTIAITDHDTIDGIEEACRAGREFDLEVIPGIELSTIDGKKEIHILGYFIDPTNCSLNAIIQKMIDARENRAVRMVEKLNELGIEITVERVREISGTTFIGRPHIARVMQEMGYIEEQSEAFTTEYIGSGGRAYIERFKITPADAISLIHEAGGVAVLAHPGYLGDRSTLGEEDIARYVGLGLDGVEVYYAKHTEEQVEYYKGLALTYGLMMTGGSDFHGGDGESIGW